MIFRQLFESVSGTYSYLLASRRGGEALIIDPVLEKVDRYLQLILAHAKDEALRWFGNKHPISGMYGFGGGIVFKFSFKCDLVTITTVRSKSE